MLKFDTTGACPGNDLFRTSIKFGINMLSECKLSYAVPKDQDACSQLQKSLYNFLLGFDTNIRSLKYGPFANSLVNETQLITNSNPPAALVNFVYRFFNRF